MSNKPDNRTGDCKSFMTQVSARSLFLLLNLSLLWLRSLMWLDSDTS